MFKRQIVSFSTILPLLSVTLQCPFGGSDHCGVQDVVLACDSSCQSCYGRPSEVLRHIVDVQPEAPVPAKWDPELERQIT